MPISNRTEVSIWLSVCCKLCATSGPAIVAVVQTARLIGRLIRFLFPPVPGSPFVHANLYLTYFPFITSDDSFASGCAAHPSPIGRTARRSRLAAGRAL